MAISQVYCWKYDGIWPGRYCRYLLWAYKDNTPEDRIASLENFADFLYDSDVERRRVGVWCQLAVGTELRPGC